MKKCIFKNKKNNTTTSCLVGNIGALVYNICNDVKSMNDAIRWCNTHKVGETYEHGDYTIKLVESDNKEKEKAVAPKTENELSPMMKQFYEFKSQHPDALLLFRCGDFYETYCDDAKDVSEILGITLTKSTNRKDKNGEYLKMAGFPHYALDTYLPKLIRAGKRVAICDQLEDPRTKSTKKIVKRGITELSNN